MTAGGAGSVGRVIGLALVAAIGVACMPSIPIDPSAIPGSRLVLMLDGRGNEPFILRINGADVGHYPCNVQQEVAPGANGVPPLPWDMEIVRQRDDAVLLAGHVTTMPKWLLMIGDNPPGMGVLPALGPAGPSCPP
jgi:hypothetical protein